MDRISLALNLCLLSLFFSIFAEGRQGPQGVHLLPGLRPAHRAELRGPSRAAQGQHGPVRAGGHQAVQRQDKRQGALRLQRPLCRPEPDEEDGTFGQRDRRLPRRSRLVQHSLLACIARGNRRNSNNLLCIYYSAILVFLAENIHRDFFCFKFHKVWILTYCHLKAKKIP